MRGRILPFSSLPKLLRLQVVAMKQVVKLGAISSGKVHRLGDISTDDAEYTPVNAVQTRSEPLPKAELHGTRQWNYSGDHSLSGFR